MWPGGEDTLRTHLMSLSRQAQTLAAVPWLQAVVRIHPKHLAATKTLCCGAAHTKPDIHWPLWPKSDMDLCTPATVCNLTLLQAHTYSPYLREFVELILLRPPKIPLQAYGPSQNAPLHGSSFGLYPSPNLEIRICYCQAVLKAWLVSDLSPLLQLQVCVRIIRQFHNRPRWHAVHFGWPGTILHCRASVAVLELASTKPNTTKM